MDCAAYNFSSSLEGIPAMPVYKAPVGDTLFLLNDVFDFQRYSNLPRFSEAPIDVVEAVLSEGGKFAEEVLQPLNLPGDREGCRRLPDGSVVTPKGFKEAYKAFVDGGWVGISASAEYGGQGLPHFLGVALSEYTIAANQAFAMYPGLTNGATAALQVHGAPALKSRYLPKLSTGEWTGTMNLTEPHCGTDLGLIKTRSSRKTVPMRYRARRFSFRRASTTSPTTSSISCWRGSKARRPA
jgi:acyl-CoA dehydrogenase